MQFQVPQFIEVEDKIFGPLTFKQFLYLAGGVGISYLLWRLLPLLLAAPVIAFVAGFSVALAFFQWNGQPFIMALEHGFYFLLHSKLYLWNNAKKPAQKRAEALQAASTSVYVPRLSESRLHELAWSLDIKERIESGQSNPANEPEDVARLRTAREARIM